MRWSVPYLSLQGYLRHRNNVYLFGAKYSAYYRYSIFASLTIKIQFMEERCPTELNYVSFTFSFTQLLVFFLSNVLSWYF